MEEKNGGALLKNPERLMNWDGTPLVKYQGFWIPEALLQPTLSFQKNFKARNSDVIISSIPKSGTTWIKALVFAIVNRRNHPIDESPLLTSNPHTLVPCSNAVVYRHEENPNLEHIPSPRIFSTHMSFNVLPASVGESECKIIYLCRNLLDQFISYRLFSLNNSFSKNYDLDPLPVEEAFDLYCRGIQPFGPPWDQMSEYWDAHLKNPGKVLFLKYEDLKEDVSSVVRQIAEFIGMPFSPEEEKQGVVEQISRLCSLENLKNLEVNKTDQIIGRVKFNTFFRKGEVGDWKNYLTPAMAERLEKLVESKLQGFPRSKLIG